MLKLGGSLYGARRDRLPEHRRNRVAAEPLEKPAGIRLLTTCAMLLPALQTDRQPGKPYQQHRRQRSKSERAHATAKGQAAADDARCQAVCQSDGSVAGCWRGGRQLDAQVTLLAIRLQLRIGERAWWS